MSVSTSFLSAESRLTIRVTGRFGFSLHKAFLDAFQKFGSGARCYTVDLTDADSVDSSALGMMLLLRDFAGGDRSNITVEGANLDIEKVLKITAFDKLFHIPGLSIRDLETV
ncbi:anti-anti-sigma factor [Litorivicinus lipolyticus]|uniref:Anti-anti-sigma factor n=1 Tax=Litorivicinus lipolyticus TaxID=418701 RepID=A0A5Q2Q827_9GAMM|nr:STAS domain-containing protein [Litorivicinus lipolyticus]QGG80248.1 anti-anti-sigma factor [Litorivicinus lipolyticus]